MSFMESFARKSEREKSTDIQSNEVEESPKFD
jgi:hypothetical protein